MFKPLNNRVLVKPDETKTQTNSGIFLTESKEKPATGVVMVGNSMVKKGEKVLFSKFGFDEVGIDNQIYYVVSENNLLGIF